LDDSHIGGVKKALVSGASDQFKMLFEQRKRARVMKEPTPVLSASVDCEDAELPDVEHMDLHEPDSSAPEQAAIKWDSNAMQLIMGHLRQFMFLPGRLAAATNISPANTRAFEELVSQETLYAPRVLTEAEVTDKLKADQNMKHFSREHSDLLRKLQNDSQLSQSEAMLVDFIMGNKISEVQADGLLQLVRNADFNSEDIRYDKCRTYKNNIRQQATGIYSFKSS
jgi:hypothetical protein